MNKRFYTVKEAAQILGVSTITVYSYLDSGKIYGKRVGRGRFRIPAVELQQFSNLSNIPISNFAGRSTNSPGYDFNNLNDSADGFTRNEQDFYFFRLFVAVILLIPNLIYLIGSLNYFDISYKLFFEILRININNYYDTSFHLISVSLSMLIFLEIFIYKVKKSVWFVDLFLYLVTIYSSLFYYVKQDYSSSALFVGILIVLSIDYILKAFSRDRGLSLDIKLLIVLITSLIIYGLSEFLLMGKMVLPLYFIGFPAILLLFSYFRNTNIDFIVFPYTSLWISLAASWFSSTGKWSASFNLFIFSVFLIFILFWRRQSGFYVEIFNSFAVGVLAVSLVVLIGLLGISAMQKNILDQNVSTTYKDLNLIEKRIQAYIDSYDRNLGNYVTDSKIFLVQESQNRRDKINYAKEIFENINNLRRVIIYDDEGVVLAAYPYDPNLEGANLGFRDYFQQVKTNVRSITTRVFTSIINEPIFLRIYPIVDGGKFKGAIAIAPNLELMSNDLSNYLSEGDLYAFDIRGNYSLNSKKEDIGSPVADYLLMHNASIKYYPSEDKLRVFKKNTNPLWSTYIEKNVSSLLKKNTSMNFALGVFIWMGSFINFGAFTLLTKKWN